MGKGELSCTLSVRRMRTLSRGVPRFGIAGLLMLLVLLLCAAIVLYPVVFIVARSR